VKRPDKRLCVRGTSSNTMSVYCDCTILPVPAVPVVTDLFGGCLSGLPRPGSGLPVRVRLTVGDLGAPEFGESVGLISPVEIG
jgi:hypothetical protein